MSTEDDNRFYREKQPVAWLMRESRHDGGSPRVVSGRVWITEDAARVACHRMQSRHWRREVFPVYALEQLR